MKLSLSPEEGLGPITGEGPVRLVLQALEKLHCGFGHCHQGQHHGGAQAALLGPDSRKQPRELCPAPASCLPPEMQFAEPSLPLEAEQGDGLGAGRQELGNWHGRYVHCSVSLGGSYPLITWSLHKTQVLNIPFLFPLLHSTFDPLALQNKSLKRPS